MGKRTPGTIGALLSTSFLSCLMALLLVAERGIPPSPQGARFALPSVKRGPAVVAAPEFTSALQSPPVLVIPSEVPVSPVLAPSGPAPAAVELLPEGGGGLRARGGAVSDGDRKVLAPDGGEEVVAPRGAPGQNPAPAHGHLNDHGRAPDRDAVKAPAKGRNPSGVERASGRTPPGHGPAQGPAGQGHGRGTGQDHPGHGPGHDHPSPGHGKEHGKGRN